MGKIKNTTTPNLKVEHIPINDINSHLYKNQKMVVDFSFEGVFVSCKTGDFDNYLKDNQEFILKFRDMVQDVYNLSQKTICQLMTDRGFSHCHPVSDEGKALNVIKSIFDMLGKNTNAFDQVVGGENIYQIGLQSPIRIFGTVDGNVFRAYFIDYHHDFEYDQRRNERNKKLCKFCVINSELD